MADAYAVFRTGRLVLAARVVGPVAAGLTLPALAKAALKAQWGEMATISMMLGCLAGPGLAAGLGAVGLVPALCVGGHCLGTLGCFCIAFGVVQAPVLVEIVSQQRYLLPELLLSPQYQAPLPLVGGLHALRCLAQCLIFIRCAHGSTLTGVLWALGSWSLLMALQCMYEARSQMAFAQQQAVTCSLQQGRRESSICFHSSVVNSNKGKAYSHQEQGGSRRASSSAAGNNPAKAMQPSGKVAKSDLPDQTTQPAVALQPSSPTAWQSHPISDVDAIISAVVAASTDSVRWVSYQNPVKATDRKHQVLSKASSRLAHPYQPYMRSHRKHTVHMKLQDLELHQLPVGFTGAVEHHLQPCLPGLLVSKVVLRHGCVMITLDLALDQDTLDTQPGTLDLGAPRRCMDAATQLMRRCQLGQHLGQGSMLQIQAVGGPLLLCSWDATQHHFTPAPDVDSLSGLVQLAGHCRILKSPAAVLCSTAGQPEQRSRQVVLQLQLPAGCTLSGWQPAGAATEGDRSHGGHQSVVSSAGSAGAGTGGGHQVALLARVAGGGYVPVTVTTESVGKCDVQQQGQQEGEQAGSPAIQFVLVCAKATIGSELTEPGQLMLELWFKGQSQAMEVRSAATTLSTGPPARPVMVELYCHSTPVVVLPAGGQAAAAELEQHSSADFTADLAAWLHSMTRIAHHPLSPGCAEEACLRRLGTGLLFHAVARNMEGVVGVVEAVMCHARAAAGTAGEAPARWLEDAAGGLGQEERGGLLHAAMASGSAQMLRTVLNWSVVHGGPRWRWSWSTTDASGCTPLHVVAVLPDPDVSEQMLQTLRQCLTAMELQAARCMWLQGEGGVGETPAAWYQAVHGRAVSDSAWHSSPASTPPSGSTLRTEASSAQSSVVSSDGTSDNPCHAADTPGLPATAALRSLQQISSEAGSGSPATQRQAPARRTTKAAASPATQQLGSWRSVYSEYLSWAPSQDYELWADSQWTSVVTSWAWAQVALAVVCCARSHYVGALHHEWLVLTLHTLGYLPLLCRALGSWQRWMWFVPVMHSLGYLYVSHLPAASAPTWWTSSRNGGDLWYMLLMSSFEQNSLPVMCLTRALLVHCHSMAYRAAGLPRPVLRTTLLHVLCVVVNACMRTLQLRGFRSWRLKCTSSSSSSRESSCQVCADSKEPAHVKTD